ncbi:hypothetical protein PVK06_040814 [Gossypium arboreum]|uniref:3'-5' exonuclease domain-containing protein n=1 Tax=Gossypium arboreum TaxID=29729 RepID=A0ABR0N7A7_GOSAR|nr:hypothetical protein PVK06_040814 [Gossypium arboreum]
MGSVERLMGDEFVMVDGTALVTEVLSRRVCRRMNNCVFIILKRMIKHDDMVAGLDITWFTSDDALVAICTWIGCVLIPLNSGSGYVTKLLSNKDITVVGVHMKENVSKMRRLLSRVEISNAVDVGELAADLLHNPRLRRVGVRRLASEVLVFQLKSRPFALSSIFFSMEPEHLTANQIECVATDAYAAYKIGKKLLGF